MNKPKLGSGKRFADLKKKLEKQGVDDPAAVAATVGREKYGPKKMAALAKHGRKK